MNALNDRAVYIPIEEEVEEEEKEEKGEEKEEKGRLWL